MNFAIVLAVKKNKKTFVRSGIRTHAPRKRLRPERSALDHSAILTVLKVELQNREFKGEFTVRVREVREVDKKRKEAVVLRKIEKKNC